MERGRRRAATSRCRRCSTRWTRVLDAAGEAHRDPAPLRGDDQGDLVAAAALRAARGRAAVPAARASALSRRLRFPRAARRRAAKVPRGARRLVDALPGRGRRRARGDAASRRGAEEAPPPRGRGRKRATTVRGETPAGDAAGARPSRPSDARRSPSSAWAATSPTRAGSSRARVARARAAAAHAHASPSRPITSPRRSARATPQPDYVNAVVALRTALVAARAARALQRIERRAASPARARSRRATRRARSTSICYYTAAVASHAPRLTVPHPRMHERAFVLRPLADIAPAATIPGRGLARRHSARVRGQRIARTRTHLLH